MQLKIFVVVSMAVVSSIAWGQPQTLGDSTRASASTTEGHELSNAERWEQAHLKVPPWTEPSGQGVGIGYQHGSWAGHWTQELRLRIPFARTFAMNAGGLFLYDEPGAATNLGGRLLITGGTPVYLNLVRIYGGGGADMLVAVNKEGSGPVWGGGGFFGFEFFMNHRSSFFIEIGGRGGQKYSGATIMAGVNFFPFYQ